MIGKTVMSSSEGSETRSEQIAAELGVADGTVVSRRLEGLSPGETVPAVGIYIDFMYLSELERHLMFDEMIKVIAQRVTAAAHTDDLVAMHGWDFVVLAESLGDDEQALTAYALELERAASEETIHVAGMSHDFTPIVRSGRVGSIWDLRLLFPSPAEENARREERRRARIEAEGPSKVDDLMDIKFMSYSSRHPDGVEVDSIYPPDWSPLVRMQMAAKAARNSPLLDHEKVSAQGEPYTIKVAHVSPLMELVKAVEAYLLPLQEAKLEEIHQDALARCPHDYTGEDPCPECEERWNWRQHGPRGIQLH
jgi:hypothetical protein